MTEARLIDTIRKYISRIVIIMFAIALIYIILAGKNEATKFMPGGQTESHSTLDIEGEGEVASPALIQCKKGERYIVRDTIPETITGDNYSMMIYTYYSKQLVYIGDELVASYGIRKVVADSRLIGNIRLIVPIDASMAGKPVTIVFTPYYDQTIDYVAPVFGQKEALMKTVIADNLGRVVIVIMLMTLFIIAESLSLYIRITKASVNSKTLSYFALFLLLVGTWVVYSSDIPQFFTNANLLVSFISFLCLSMIGIAYNGFCEQLFEEQSKLFGILYLVGWILPFINISGFFIGICDPMALLPLTHLYFTISGVVTIFVAFSSWRKAPETRLFSLSLGFLVATAIVALIVYYIAPTTGRPGYIIGIGLLVFSYGLMITIARKFIHATEQNNDIVAFRELAYEDVMTGLGNRSKFEKFFDDIDDMGIEGKSVTLFMFDLNFLKKVNDEFGHKAGDQLLIGLAKCIEKSFSKMGSAYRLGGDEFAAIVTGRADQVLNIIEDFKKTIDDYNKYNEHHISTAIGYATRKFRHGDPDFYVRLFREADDAMYSNKVRMHEELGEEVRNIKKD